LANSDSTRSVKIDSSERGGWSSDRPRPGGGPDRPPNLAVRCRVLTPSESLRYSPGSLLVIVSGSKTERDGFAERLIDDRSSLMSLDKVRGLLAERVPQEELEERAAELLEAAARKRLEAGETVVVAADGLDAGERERYLRLASRFKRPSHVILVEGGQDELDDEGRSELNKLRRRLDAGELGEEGFNTALRLGGSSLAEVRRISFAPAPRDD
jgi:predicted kinase